MRKLSIRYKLTLLIAILGVLTVVVLGLLSEHFYIRQLEKQYVLNTKAALNLKSNDYNLFFNTAKSDLNYIKQLIEKHCLATNPSLSQPFIRKIDSASLQEILRELVEERGTYKELLIYDESGKVTTKITHDGLNAHVNYTEEKLNGRSFTFPKITPVRDTVLISYPQLSFEAEGLTNTSFVPIIQMAAPVFDHDQKIRRYVVIYIYLNEMIRSLDEPSEGELLMVDKAGYFVVHPDESKRWGRELKTEENIKRTFPDYGKTILSGNEGVIKLNDSFIIYSPVYPLAFNKSYYYVLLRIYNYSTLHNLSHPIHLYMLCFGSLFLLAIIIISYILVYHFTRPFIALRDGARDIINGRYNQIEKPFFWDEVGELCESFNLMSNTLKERNKELEVFFYKASHDLKAPLKTIEGVLNLCDRENKIFCCENSLHMRKTIVKSSKMMEDVAQISNIYHPELKIQDINLQSIVENVLHNLKYLADRNHITIRTNISSTLPFYTDENHLDSILQNLVQNALIYYDSKKTASNTGSFVYIKAYDTIDGIIIQIEDNGVGIEKEHLDNIFNMFYRASEKEGSGLGLYLVKFATTKLGGKISVSSRPLQGTIFTLFIPNLAQNKEKEHLNYSR
ncbi:MAG: sensor histidine kinase [Cyclobacteriaceae bacterium]|nr:sensor histidine kinase [Cyclobacteriaceae bacterium]